MPFKGRFGRRQNADAALRGSAADATADAAMTELEPSNRRRLIEFFLGLELSPLSLFDI